jgi:hypothetical protein
VVMTRRWCKSGVRYRAIDGTLGLLFILSLFVWILMVSGGVIVFTVFVMAGEIWHWFGMRDSTSQCFNVSRFLHECRD